MPIPDVDKANQIVVLKRSMKPGFAGIDNPLYGLENTSMLFGDAKSSTDKPSVPDTPRIASAQFIGRSTSSLRKPRF